MPSHILRPLLKAELSPGDLTLLPVPFDLSEYKELEIVVRVLRNGVAALGEDGEAAPATLVITHAPTADAETWLDLPNPVAVDLSVAGDTWIHVPYFTAFLAITLTGLLEQPATITVEIVAKR